MVSMFFRVFSNSFFYVFCEAFDGMSLLKSVMSV